MQICRRNDVQQPQKPVTYRGNGFVVLAFLCQLYIRASSSSILLSVTKILLYMWHGKCDIKEMQGLLFLMKFWWTTIVSPVNSHEAFSPLCSPQLTETVVSLFL